MDNKLREIRLDIGMPIAELARRAKTSRQTIHAIENKSRKSISGSLMFRIADALKRDEREIFFDHHVTHVEQSA
ncbi:helix-turn-helix transcriptional regulator [Cohnella zeiphila]|nr:helix-turn-helix transcriptional regulator [Cohnella zeiphila]